MPTTRPRPHLAVATILSLAGLVGVWLLQNFIGERTGPTALLTYFPPHGWALFPIILGLMALRRRRAALLGLNLLGLLFWAKWILGFNVPLRISAREKTAPTLRILTYNVQRGERGTPELISTIKSQRPDIVCLQESQHSTPNGSRSPGDVLQSEFRGWNAARAGDVMTLSRFPLASWRSYPLRGTRRILETTWHTPRGPIRVLNVHVATSYPRQRRTGRGLRRRLSQVARDAQPSAQARLDQIAPIFRAVATGNPHIPLVVAGDFNTPPRGLFYRALTSELDDSWTRNGWGTGHTFPSRLP
ncbi:MAG: endonuclease/exonuclease/phosphatase family protein, partial [Armatimonadetes bacterium]|nr:endonuclease/exonuclease/phosphatase family protein [Armatimonadota bacterium]